MIFFKPDVVVFTHGPGLGVIVLSFIISLITSAKIIWIATRPDLESIPSNIKPITSNEDASLVTRNIEYRDNVIPASNSIMAKNLFKLSHYFDNEAYIETATTMLNNMQPEIEDYPSSYSNWLDLMLNFTNNYYEVAIVGDEVLDKIKDLNKTYIPNKLIIGSENDNDLPLLKNRYVAGKTLIYVCVNKACKYPVTQVNEAIKLIQVPN